MDENLNLKHFINNKESSRQDNGIPASGKRSKSFRIKVILVLLILAILGIAYFAFNTYTELQRVKGDKDVDTLKAQLAKVYVMPTGEPIIASVNDVEKLRKEQAFYNKAENGDKIFIWGDKAVIYRPSIEKIVDFGIIITASATPTPTAIVTTTSTPTTSPTKAGK